MVASQFQRVPVRQPGGVHPAAHRVCGDLRGQVVPVGTGLPEVAYGCHYQTGVDLRKGVVAYAESLHCSRTEALHQDVRALYHLSHGLDAIRRLEVQGDSPLVGVQKKECAALLRMGCVFGEGAQCAGVVSDARALDFDHVGAVVAQELGAVRSGYALSEVYDPKARKRLRYLMLFHVSPPVKGAYWRFRP